MFLKNYMFYFNDTTKLTNIYSIYYITSLANHYPKCLLLRTNKTFYLVETFEFTWFELHTGFQTRWL